MKRILLIVFICIVSMILSLILFLYAYEQKGIQEQSFYRYSFSEDEYGKLKDGDFILRHGYGLVSDAIVERLDEEYDISHCAVICKTDTGFVVVQSISSSISDFDGVQTQDLKSFILQSQKNSIIVVRYKPEILKDSCAISRKAKDYLKMQVPFDEEFDINDTSEFYCTELLYRIILNEYHDDIMVDQNNQRMENLNFKLFLDSTRFDVILNHHLRKQKPDSKE